MAQYFIEMTDTFAGEANYSWVKRFTVHAKTVHGAVQKFAREVGAGWKCTGNYGESFRFDNGCICIFIEEFDEDKHKAFKIQEI